LIGATADDLLSRVWQEYRKWYFSQSEVGESRAPGESCLNSLSANIPGSLQKRINQSAGCGGIMRVHPVGIAFYNDARKAFMIGMQIAALTHGHPNGYIPSGFMAALVAGLVSGKSLKISFKEAWLLLDSKDVIDQNDAADTKTVLKNACESPVSGDHGMIIDREVGQSNTNGGGWLGHDALAIAIYAVRCFLAEPLEAVRVAVNHSGDSDSTGSIAGAIIGAIYGPELFNNALEQQGILLERREELEMIGRFLVKA
jgi:ADP-ribosylglycohydrolase